MTTVQTTTPTKLLTAEEFYEWANRPEHRGRIFELERGRIVEMSRPGKLHGLICANVTGILRNYAIQRGKGYPCSNDTGIVVARGPDTVRGPDVLFFEDVENVEEVEEKYGETPPVLAVEVLSPNDTHGTVMRRVLELMAFGVRIVWVLDPDARNVAVHYPGVKDRVVEEGAELTGNDVLPDFRCAVADFFNLPGKPRQVPPESTSATGG
jgi:Uma2 family endonuclease